MAPNVLNLVMCVCVCVCMHALAKSRISEHVSRAGKKNFLKTMPKHIIEQMLKNKDQKKLKGLEWWKGDDRYRGTLMGRMSNLK